MSVINQMLKELDQRKTGAADNSETSPSYNHSPSTMNSDIASRHKKITIFAVVFAVVISVTATIVYFKFMNNIINVEDQQVIQLTDKEITSDQVSEINLSVKTVPQVAQIAKNTESNPTQDIPSPESNNEITLIDNSVENHTAVITSDKSNKIELKPVSKANSQEEQVQQNTQQKIVKSQLEPSNKIKAKNLFKLARQNIENNQRSIAKKQLNQAIHFYPELHKARVLLMSILLQQNAVKILAPQIEQSLKSWPNIHEYRQIKARLLLQQQLQTEALEVLTKTIPAVIDAPEYHALIAYIAQQLVDDTLALKHYRLLLEQYPARSDWWLGFAVSEERLGHKDSALRAYQQTIGRPGLSKAVREYAQKRIKILQGY